MMTPWLGEVVIGPHHPLCSDQMINPFMLDVSFSSSWMGATAGVTRQPVFLPVRMCALRGGACLSFGVGRGIANPARLFKVDAVVAERPARVFEDQFVDVKALDHRLLLCSPNFLVIGMQALPPRTFVRRVVECRAESSCLKWYA
ncbi:unnamed protein product [Hapterophycus canaliculatus]